MAVITAGNAAIDRTSVVGGTDTLIDYNHPISGSGTITHLKWFLYSPGTLIFGIVHEVTPGTYNTLRHLSISLQPAGLGEVDADLPCVAGDHLAIWVSSLLDKDSGGGVGAYFHSGDVLSGNNQGWTATADPGMQPSFEATGETGALPSTLDDSCEGIAAWLDAIEATYVPCVDAWLVANP